MIDPDKRNAIFQLHQEGMSLREISRRMHVSRNAVRAIVKQQGKIARKQREDKKQIDTELLERLYRECDGWIQRIHEKLVEEEGIEVGYSTLTRMLRERGLSRKRHKRKTTIITSNLGFGEWGSFLNNPQLTAALIDRLTSNSHVINMKDCDSLRGGIDK